jgi:hypothetical protein
MHLTLQQLRAALASHPHFAEWDDGDRESVYLQLGEKRSEPLRPETRTRGDDRDLVLLLDEAGRVQGIELV